MKRLLVMAAAWMLFVSVSDAHAWAPLTSSAPVWSGTVPYQLNSAGSADLGAMSESIVRTGMDDWTRVSCTSLRNEYGGTTDSDPVSGDRRSMIGWVESGWEHDPSAIGVTMPLFTSEIIEADMQLNGEDYTWIAAAGSGRQVDGYSIVLHEGGHYYGLGHSENRSATMYFAYSGGRSSLTTDDQNGICALYPGSGSTDCTTTGCPTGQACVDGVCVRPTGDGTMCAPCSSSADCSGGACLQYPDGGHCGTACGTDGDCDASAICAPTRRGSFCVRVSGDVPSCEGSSSGCTSDAGCDISERCNTATGRCEPRAAAGGDLGAACGSGSECRSSLCFTGTCTQTCDWLNPASCPGGWHCSAEATGSCGGSGVCVQGGAGAAAFGAPCQDATECASLYCGSGVCSQPCVPDGAASCPSGTLCQVGEVAGCGSCQRSGGLGDICETNDDCTSRVCASSSTDSFCTEYCDAMNACPSGSRCTAIAGTNVSVCVPESGGLGSACTSNDQCASQICASSGSGSFCTRLCDDHAAPCPGSFACLAVQGDPSTHVCRRVSSGNCGCALPGRNQDGHPVLVLMAAVGIVWMRRRR